MHGPVHQIASRCTSIGRRATRSTMCSREMISTSGTKVTTYLQEDDSIQTATANGMEDMLVDRVGGVAVLGQNFTSVSDYAICSHGRATRLVIALKVSWWLQRRVPMPKLEDSLIDKLTPRPEVREKARALLRTLHSKTGPGTGHDIGEAKIGLPAICAYIASKR
jgi:hypothetical protein